MERRWKVEVWSLALAIVIQTMCFVYQYGRLTERVDRLQQDTQMLLRLQLKTQAERLR